MSTSTLGQGPSPRKNPFSAMGRIPHRPGMAEDKGNGLSLREALRVPWLAEDKGNDLSLREALRVTPWNRKSTKTKKDNGKNGNV